jgi:hypothetical protein
MLNTDMAVSLLDPSDAIWCGASYFAPSPHYLAGLGTGYEEIVILGNSPPVMALVG